MHSLETISHYGYIACYVALALGLFGLPVPDEIVLTFIGTLTATSSFSYTSVLFITFGGVLTGALSTYGIGRWIGAPFLQRFGHWIGLNEQRLATIDKWSKSYGSKMAFIGFLMPGMRHLICYFAGMNKLSLKKSAGYAISGAIVSTVLYITIGHYIARSM